MNLLFTCVGSRNYLLRYFKSEMGQTSRILATDLSPFAPALREADKAIVVKAVNHPDYINNLIDICVENKVDAIISLNDFELPILSKAKHFFRQVGTQILVSDSEIIDICFDKWRTSEFLKKIGINAPRTYLEYEKALEDIENKLIGFPLVVKPRWGSASIGIQTINTRLELESIGKMLCDSSKTYSLCSAAWTVDKMKSAYIIQQKMEGQEFGLDIVNDLKGEYVCTFVKEKRAMRAGETDIATTRSYQQLENAGKKIGQALGHISLLDADFFCIKDQIYGLELNPRFGGGYPFSHMAGANIPKAILSWLCGEQAEPSSLTIEFDKTFSKFNDLVEIP